MEKQIVLPRLRVERAPTALFALENIAAWDQVKRLEPLWLADGSAPATQPTRVCICFDETALYVRFDCEDRDIWGTYTQRDEPLYEEEVVEVFFAAGTDDPKNYFEFEVSPNGVLFDTTVSNPTSTRADLRWDETWNCPGVRWLAARNDAAETWWAALAIPWIGVAPNEQVPSVARANFCRIERPRNSEPEFSCWSPTMTNPADFHKPMYFGILEFE